jgi:hypothetical protein
MFTYSQLFPQTLRHNVIYFMFLLVLLLDIVGAVVRAVAAVVRVVDVVVRVVFLSLAVLVLVLDVVGSVVRAVGAFVCVVVLGVVDKAGLLLLAGSLLVRAPLLLIGLQTKYSRKRFTPTKKPL